MNFCLGALGGIRCLLTRFGEWVDVDNVKVQTWKGLVSIDCIYATTILALEA